MIARLFEKQWLHVLGLGVLLWGVAFAARGPAGEPRDDTALWVAVRLAVVHQVFVWFCWRMELHQRLLSTVLGRAAFPVYAAAFALLGVARAGAVWVVAWQDQGTLAGQPDVWKALGALLLLPAGYTFWSVARWFGLRRALGGDHFEPALRRLPLVRAGAFRWTPNAMYTFGFLFLWAPALWWASQQAVVVAAFNHLYVWVHWFATERPDLLRMRRASAAAGG